MRETRASSGDGTSAEHIRANAKGPMATRQVYALLTLIAASIVGARIMTAPGAYSVNDQSRWATIRALVDTGRYSIGYREEYPDGTHRDFGIIALDDWQSADVVMHPTTKRFSDRPALA